jgi:hypothetical protein
VQGKEDSVSCNADKAIQILIQRELQRRVDGLNAIVERHMSQWASRHGMSKPKHIAATALSAGAEFAVGEALKTVLAPIVAVITPPLPPDVRHAQQPKYLLLSFRKVG